MQTLIQLFADKSAAQKAYYDGVVQAGSANASMIQITQLRVDDCRATPTNTNRYVSPPAIYLVQVNYP